jgi:hypothetical protein
MNQNNDTCRLLEAWLDDQLDSAQRTLFLNHALVCEACRDQIEAGNALKKHIKPIAELNMPDDADLRVRIAIETSTRIPTVEPEVMGIEEAAAFLRITIRELIDCLDELPAFEIAGRIRFNRDRLIRWMLTKEQGFASEMRRKNTPKNTVILTFPGGSNDEQFNRKANGSPV